MSDDELLRLPPGVVTGEAVLLELVPASFLTRALAQLLDVVLQVALLVGLELLAALALGGADDAAYAAASVLVPVAVLVGLPVLWESLSRGRSPGKAAAGLRVVRDDGGPVRARQAVVRALVGFPELWMMAGGPAIITSLASRQGKRLGDLLAGTLVVRERAGAGRAAPLVMPPELAGWARSADIGRLPDALATAARTVLGRAERLHPGSRERLLGDLAAQVLARVAPPPPPGTPPERLLAAVLAERRERDWVRLARARDRRDSLAQESRRLQGI